MNRQELEKLSTPELKALALHAMALNLRRHFSFLERVLRVRVSGEALLRSAVRLGTAIQASTPISLAAKQVADAPGRFTDPRIEELPLELIERLVGLVARMGSGKHFDFAEQELSDLVEDVRQFDADIEPVYAWHKEIVRDMAQAKAELN